MYATAEIEAEIATDAVLVPREAVIDTGERQVAFLALEGGHFEPREVVMGAPAEGGMVQILEGLTPGQSVVTSGQFLLDAESRFREALAKFQADGARETPAPGTPPAGMGGARQHDHAGH
jgi:multidrug efflux pump subunit AcrA (membrane-fusion protein)